MCGILGLVTNFSNGGQWKDVQMFEDLLYFDAVRGRDSTGVAMLTNEAGARLLKSAGHAQQFILSKEWDELGSEFISKGKALIGHNRKKTVGAVSDDTAHPFLIDNRYMFIHNGTLYSHKHLADTEVDSEALGIHLTKCKTKEELEEALSNVYGAYACSWIDIEQEKLFLLRNKDRPLYLGKYKDGWAFCSESGMMRAAFGREGVLFDEVQEVPADCLIEFNLAAPVIEPVTTALTIKKYPATTTQPAQTSGGPQQTTTNITGIKGAVSKNAYKRIAKQNLLGKEVTFQIVDYVERFPNDKDKKEFCIMAETKDLPFNHILHFNLKEMDEETLNDFYMPMEWKGTLNLMMYNNKAKHVDIFVKAPTPTYNCAVH